jgi:hypothetical protein
MRNTIDIVTVRRLRQPLRPGRAIHESGPVEIQEMVISTIALSSANTPGVWRTGDEDMSLGG